MDLSSVEIFVAVADSQSVTRSAQRLERAPSNVTTRIQQLEQKLGVNLFSRNSKKMTLTEEGRAFLPYAKKLIALEQEARNAVKALDVPPVLNVGTMESTAASRLPPVLAAFSSECGTPLQLTLGATRELIRAVESEALHCALIAAPHDEPEWFAQAVGRLDHLHSVRVFQEDLLLVFPSTHRSVEQPTDIAVPSLAALEPGCTYRQVAERWIGSAARCPTLELSSYHSILAHVVAGNAVGVMPLSVLNMLPWNSEVRTRSIGVIDTLLISRAGDRPPTLGQFEQILLASSAATADKMLQSQFVQ